MDLEEIVEKLKEAIVLGSLFGIFFMIISFFMAIGFETGVGFTKWFSSSKDSEQLENDE